jgi:VIT1/CCC1 family predicted Fe2+/Mn2+ transporter
MLDGNQEQERLKRLREQQLRARNPKKKEQQFQRITADHERRRDRSYTLNDLWKDTPIIIRYMLIGFLLGLLIAVALPLFWQSPWLKLVSLVVIVAITAFSGIVGNAVAARDKIKDLMR